MDVLDAVRTTFALLVGYVVTVAGIELLPTISIGGVGLPVSLAIAGGVLVTIGIRRGLGTTAYGTLTGTVLFLVVGAAMLAQGDSAPIATGHAHLLVYLGIGGLIANEILVRTAELVAAGGIENSDRHRFWAVPAAIVGVVIIAAREFNLDGTGRLFAWTSALLTLVAHVLVTALGVTAATTPVFALALCAMFALFPATSPQRVVDGTSEGSILGACFAWISGTTRRAVAGARALGSRTPVLARRMETVVRTLSVPSIGASAATTDGGVSASAVGSTGGSASKSPTSGPASPDRAQESTDSSSPGERGSTTSTNTDRSGSSQQPGATERSGTDQSKTDSSNTAQQNTTEQSTEPTVNSTTGTTAGAGTNTRERTCGNCGRQRSTVRPRSIVRTESDRATGMMDLCACCHAARRCEDIDWGCDTAVPVSRNRVLTAADGRCRACGRGPAEDLELHPIVPLESRGHPHEYNVAPLCPSCHKSAHSQ